MDFLDRLVRRQLDPSFGPRARPRSRFEPRDRRGAFEIEIAPVEGIDAGADTPASQRDAAQGRAPSLDEVGARGDAVRQTLAADRRSTVGDWGARPDTAATEPPGDSVTIRCGEGPKRTKPCHGIYTWAIRQRQTTTGPGVARP